MMLWAFLLMLIKENMIIVAACFGIRALFVSAKDDRKLLILFIVACVSVFVYFVMILIPYFRGLEQHAFTVRYAWLGHNVPEVLLSPILHPQELLKRMVCPLNRVYLLNLFSYLLLPAIFSPAALFMMLPLLLQHMLSDSIPEHTIYYHYVPTMAPFIFFALIETLVKITKIKIFSKYVYQIILVLLVVSFPVLLTYQKTLVHRWDVLGIPQASKVWKMIGQIPSGAPVIATFRFLAPLSTRSEVYSFHKLYSDEFNDPKEMGRNELNTHKGFVLSERVGYALLDLDDPWYVATFKLGKESELKRIDAFFNDPNWKVIYSVDKLLLLKRKSQP
jgi:uncharacterized membrane protein